MAVWMETFKAITKDDSETACEGSPGKSLEKIKTSGAQIQSHNVCVCVELLKKIRVKFMKFKAVSQKFY